MRKKIFIDIFKNYKLEFFLILIFVIINSLLEIFSIGLLLPLIDFLNVQQSSNKIVLYINSIFNFFDIRFNLTVALLTFFGVILLKNFFKLLQTFFFLNIRNKITFDTAKKIFANLMDVSYAYFHNTKKGELAFTMSNAAQIGGMIFSFNSILLNAALLGCYVVLLFILSYELAAITLLMTLFVFPLFKLLIGYTKKYSEKFVASAKKYNSLFIELIDGIQIIKSYAKEESVYKKFMLSYKNKIDALLKVRYISTSMSALFEPITVFILITLIFIAKNYLLLEFVNIIVFLLIVYKFVPHTQRLIKEINNVFEQLPIVNNALDSISKMDKPYLTDGTIKLKQFDFSIKFENVSFSYSTDINVLKNISTTLKKNQMTAVVGATGAGKSAFVELLLRFYDPASGNILIDDIQLNNIVHNDWLNIIGFAPQNVFLFDMSIADNIRFAKEDALMNEIIETAEIANAHNFIMQLPDGYDTIIGERGIKLSGGQKQMIALTRALIKKPQILILDEATSALDNESERLIQNALDKIRGKLTIIAIAHRLSTIKNADKIIVIDKGEIVEEGAGAYLLARNGLFKKYYDLQFVS